MDNYTSDIDDDTERVISEQHRELMDFLANNDEMKKAAKSSLKQGLYAGGGAVAGGLLMGPVGGLVGGIAGSIVGFLQSDNYDGAIQQILILESTRKARLMEAVRLSLIDAGATSPSSFASSEAFRRTLTDFASQRIVRDQIWKACMDAIEHD